jgi:RNA polymerase sigma-70 factor (ECF subfamily)
MNISDEKVLIEMLQKDNREAFEQVFHLYHKRVFAFAYGVLHSSEDAEEIVQNVFLSVWNQRKTLLITTSFIAYIYGIARHMVSRFIRHKLQHEAFIEYFLEQNREYDFITEDEIFYNELTEFITKAIAEIPERRREIFLLSRQEGLSYREIAEKLGITENTVDTQIRHALDYLRTRILLYR